jgi:predicted nucleic acid-binding protein
MQIADTLVLKIDKSKKKAFLEMLKWLDFVEVQTQKSVLQRFVKNAPQNVPLSYDDIVTEVMAHRYGKK